jgi:formylglycine-generating enzyme required for sulfatase activity
MSNHAGFLIAASLALACAWGMTAQAAMAAPPTAPVAPADGLSLDLGNHVALPLARIPAGTFLMGSPEAEKARSTDEGPQHAVTISRPFYLGIYPVTQAQYQQIMGVNPSATKGPTHPVERVPWEMAVAFCRKLSAQTDRTVRLPTEAEFEYATRAGTTTRYFYGDDPDYKQMGDYAWYYRNCKLDLQPVGQKKPNPWGLYDVYSNVWQWCSDWYGDTYPPGTQTDPQGPATGEYRVLRGGCWLVSHHTMADGQGRMLSRSALRGTPGYYDMHGWDRPPLKGAGRIGFRVVVE